MTYPHKERTYSHRDKHGSPITKGDSVVVARSFIGIGGACCVKEDDGGLYLENSHTTRQLYLDLVLSQLLEVVNPN
jgi:hypothetical protein